MSERKLTAVQCYEDAKAKIDRATETLRWTLPQVMDLVGDAIDIMLFEEETPEQRKTRLLAKLNGPTGARQKSGKSLTPVGQESHKALTPVGQESHNGSTVVEVAS